MILANSDVGLYKFRKELIERLLEQYEVHIVLPYGSFVDELVQTGCFFHAAEFHGRGTNPFHDIRLFFKFYSVMRNIRPDVVLTYTIKPNIYGGAAALLLRIPYIANITGLGTAVEIPGILSAITTTLYKLPMRKAKKVFFQNEANLEFMKSRNIVKDNYAILPGSGVNLQQYKILPFPKGETVDFVFVARVMKEKGIDQYLEAAEYISSKYPYTRFHICGVCSNDYKNILAEACRSKHVIYHGVVNDMLPIYEKITCTVHPTYYPEGMSNVLLESCAAARPIITTNRPGCREIVDDGVNGYIVREKDSADLIEKLELFLQQTPEQMEAMGMRGREKVVREFDRNIVIEKYLKEISDCG